MRRNMTDSFYMQRAIELAKGGIGAVNPNPLVGAVIVKDGRIIGEGFHERYGELHAERNAIKNLKESAEGAAMYVTLEPCCHYGKQPPCTEAVIENKIARVVIGSKDPNPLVAGKGVKRLRDAGIRVDENFMKEECDGLNDVFFHFIRTKTPYVVMKYAMTADGKIATYTGKSKWITGKEAREAVQVMRNTYTGIMAGIGTVLADDPMLNVRTQGKRSPVRIICDSRLRIPINSQIIRTAKDYRTVLACALPDCVEAKTDEKLSVLKAHNVEVIRAAGEDGRIDLKKLMRILGEMKIDGILLEGGGTLNYSALRAGIVNEVKAFAAPKIFGGKDSKSPVEGKGVESVSEAVGLKLYDISRIGEDVLLSYKVKKS